MGCGYWYPGPAGHPYWREPAGTSTLVDKLREAVGASYIASGKQIVGVGVHSVRDWDAESGLPMGQPVSPPPGTVSLIYSDIGRHYATLAVGKNEPGMFASLKGTDIQLRDESMQPIGRPLHHDKPVSSLAMSPMANASRPPARTARCGSGTPTQAS